jgi:ABC-type branched-subunit amino acid transport system ATPase component
MFGGLTVLESLLVAQWLGHGAGGSWKWWRLRLLRQGAAGTDELQGILAMLGLFELRNAVCSSLPLLAQRKVEVARALAAHPRLLLLDEPSAGATHQERQELKRVIEQVHATGIGVLVIEHNVPFVADVSSQVWVLDFGAVIAHGAPGQIQADPRVQQVYIGA